MTSTVKDSWLPFGAYPEAAVRLLCLPHAGAGASAYRAWGRALPSSIGVCPAQPPGRERRYKERPLTDVTSIVEALAPRILSEISQPYAVFGHSTGALCAFELTRQIRRAGGPAPAHLFLAGRRAPHLPLQRADLSQLTVEELRSFLRHLGGSQEELLASNEILRKIHPLLIADFAVNEDYRYHTEPPVDVPLTVFAATDDPGATVPQMREWSQHTTAGFTVHRLAGGHFAVLEHGVEVRAQIVSALRYLLPLPAQPAIRPRDIR